MEKKGASSIAFGRGFLGKLQWKNVDKLSCLHVEASKLYTAAAATAAAARRRIEVV